MEVFVTVMNAINDIIWHPVMCVFLMCAAVWFTVRLRGIQVRRFKDMVKCLTEKGDNKKDTGLSAFQAFATTVGGRVGTGNIAGTATAIFMGGPGALFWMWITAILGASTGIVECILGQAYKTRNLGELTGGPAFYLSNGIKNKTLGKTLAVLFCIAVFIGPGFLLPAMQTQTAATAVNGAFGISFLFVGILMTVIVGIVTMGGIKRIGQVAELLAPIMCGIYFIITIIILVVNIDQVPSVFGSIFASAFGKDAVFGGIVGSALAWGIKRGFFSNDAGNGMSPLIAATTDTSHPVKQGLMGAFEVFADTIVICTLTGFVVVMAHCWTGENAQVWAELDKLPKFTESIAVLTPGTSMNAVITFLVTLCFGLFAFTCLLGMISFSEIAANRIRKDAACINIVRCIALFVAAFGILCNLAGLELGNLWAFSDLGNILIVYFNVPIVFAGARCVFKATKHYKKNDGTPFDSGVIDRNDCVYWDEKKFEK